MEKDKIFLNSKRDFDNSQMSGTSADITINFPGLGKN